MCLMHSREHAGARPATCTHVPENTDHTTAKPMPGSHIRLGVVPAWRRAVSSADVDSQRTQIGEALQAWLRWCLRQCDKRGKRKRPVDARSATCVPMCICGGTGCATGMTSCVCMFRGPRWGGEDLQKLILNKGGVQTDLVHCPGGEGVSGEMGGDSLFFDYDCPLRTKKRDDIVLDIDWSTRSGEPARRAKGESWLCSPSEPR